MTKQGYQGDELSSEEKKAFQALSEENPDLPGNMEEDMVRMLKDHGLLGQKRSFYRKKLFWLPVAASITAFLIGFFIGKEQDDGSGVIVQNESKFVLFLYEGDNFEGKTEDEMVSDYITWAQEVSREGHLVSGEKLEGQKQILGDRDQGELSGYFIIFADDLSEAVRISETHPHLKYGGSIEVRPIEDL